MKKSLSILIALGVAGRLLTAVAQPAPENGEAPVGEQPAPPPVMEAAPAGNSPEGEMPPPPPEAVAAAAAEQMPPPEAPVENNTEVKAENPANATVAIQPSQPLGSETPKVVATFMPPTSPGTNNGELRMNFKNAPLEMVLNYLSDAAGFIIVLDTQVRGNVSIISSHPVTKDEAVNLLNSVLNKNGYAAIRDGRTLTIVDKSDAKTRDIPVKSGNNPAEIPKTAEIVTQIIPIRFVDARQLVSDLSSFVSPQATVVANEAGNSIVITDTQQNIRHLAEIIRAIDNSAEAETEIRVFRLQYASPADVAATLAGVFPSSSSGGTQTPTRFGGGGGGGGGFFQRMMGGGGGGNSSSSSSNDRLKKATAVTAVADSRIQAVIVTAPKDLMNEIAGMMKDLDVPSDRDQKVYVFHMENADPQQAATVLQGMFQGNNSRTTSSSQNSALQQRAINNATTSSSSSSSGSGFGTSSSRTGTGGRSF